MAYRDMPRGVQLCSYLVKKPNADTYMPHFYNRSEGAAVVRSGPALVSPSRPLLFGLTDWDEGTAFHTFTANELVEQLDDERLDCIVAASAVYERNREKFIRCARIVRSSCELMFCVPSEPQIGFRARWDQIRNAQGSGVALPVIYARNTIAQATLADLRRSPDGAGVRMEPQGVLLGDWSVFVSECLKPVLARGQTFLFVGWQPHISWLKSVASAENTGATFESGYLNELGSAAHSPAPPALSFDLLFPRATFDDWLTRRELKLLLDRVTTSASEISDGRGPDPATVAEVAHYLDISAKTCSEDMAGQDFGVLYYPEWVNGLLGIVGSQKNDVGKQ